MAIATETVVLKVEGKTDGAVRATEKLAASQQKLKREVSATSQAMSQIPATRTTGLIGNIGNALKTAGIDAQGFSKGLRDIGKGLTFDLIRRQLKGLGESIDGVAGSALSAGANGAAMGAAFGGPFGAAIGGAAGALIGLIRHTDRQSAASLRAADAARKHAEALKLVAEGETRGRQARRGTREAVELAEEELIRESMAATRAGLSLDAANVERARRALREVQAEQEALRRADGVIWLEQRKRELERINLIKDTEAAVRSGIITQQEATRRLKEFDRAQSDSIDIIGRYREKQQETAEAVARLNKALQEGRINAKEYEELLRSADEDYRRRDDERRRREEEAIKRTRQLAEERRRLVNAEADRLTDDLIKRLEGEIDRSVTTPLGAPTNDTAGIDVEDIYRRQAVASNQALVAHQEMANAIQREADLMREYTSLVGEAYGAIVDGSGGAVEALKNVAKQHLVALGMREAVEAASQFAYGLGALANPLFAGAAAMHFASAAKHAGAAALAGVGVAAVGAIGGGGGASSASSAASAGVGYGGGSSGQPTQTVTNYIIVGDSMSEDSPRMRQRNAERVVELGTQRTSVGRAE